MCVVSKISRQGSAKLDCIFVLSCTHDLSDIISDRDSRLLEFAVTCDFKISESSIS